MQQVCLECGRTTPSRNLYCQEPACPAERAPLMLAQGEWLGDIEIIRPIVVQRSAVVYAAQHQRRMVLLKVAHPGAAHVARLKREAEFLKGLPAKLGEQLVFLPRLLPPYANSTIVDRPYGKATLGEQLMYFCLYEFFEGDALSAVLARQPQPWVFHSGWIMLGLASTIAYLQSQQRLHLAISPDSLLLRFDPASNAPEILVIDLGLLSAPEDVPQHWYTGCVAPAYTAPELIGPRPRAGYPSDVYGLGLTLYELLVGAPRFPYATHSSTEIYQLVGAAAPLRQIERSDVERTNLLALRAIHPDPAQRPDLANRMREELLAIYGSPPRPRHDPRRRRSIAFIAVIALLTLAFLIIVAVTFELLAVAPTALSAGLPAQA